MRTPRQKRAGRRRTYRQRGGMDGVGSSSASSSASATDAEEKNAALSLFDIVKHDFVELAKKGVFSRPGFNFCLDFSRNPLAQELYNQPSELAVYTFISSHADAFMENGTARMNARTFVSLTTPTDAYPQRKLPNPFGSGQWIQTTDAGQQTSAWFEGMLDGLNLGSIADPAPKNIKTSIMFVKEKAEVHIPLRLLGIKDPYATIILGGVAEPRNIGTVKAVLRYTDGKVVDMVDPTRTDIGTDGAIAWAKCKPKTVNPNARDAQEAFGWLRSIEGVIGVLGTNIKDLIPEDVLGKTFGDPSQVVCMLPPTPARQNDLYGIGDKTGQWYTFQGELLDPQPDPQGYVFASLDLTAIGRGMMLGVNVNRQRMRTKTDAGGRELTPGTARPDALLAVAKQRVTASKARAETQFATLLESVQSLTRKNCVFCEGQTPFSQEQINRGKASLEVAITKLRAVISDYYGALETRVNAMENPVEATKLAEFASEALNSLAPRRTTLFGGPKNRVLRTLTLVSVPAGFTWYSEERPLSGVFAIADMPSAFSRGFGTLDRAIEALKPPAPASAASAAATASSSSPAPGRRPREEDLPVDFITVGRLAELRRLSTEVVETWKAKGRPDPTGLAKICRMPTKTEGDVEDKIQRLNEFLGRLG